jgi:hypothetical protein
VRRGKTAYDPVRGEALTRSRPGRDRFPFHRERQNRCEKGSSAPIQPWRLGRWNFPDCAMMEPMNEGDSGFPRIGEEQAGEFARKQLEAARNDPRLSRDDGRAMMADFWDAMEEAERVRTLNQLGLEELTHALEREEDRQGVRRDAEESSPVATRSLQAAWERAESARAELANESPHSNAQTLKRSLA